MCGRYYWHLWVKPSAAARQPIMHRTVPPTKNCLAQNINEAEFEQHRSNKKQRMQGSSLRENVQGLADAGTAEGEEPQARAGLAS